MCGGSTRWSSVENSVWRIARGSGSGSSPCVSLFRQFSFTVMNGRVRGTDSRVSCRANGRGLRDPTLERGDAGLVTRAQPADVVHARLEVALHRLADRLVLLEDRASDADHFLVRGARVEVSEEVVVQHEGAAVVDRDEPLDVHAVGVDVECEVRIAPQPTARVHRAVACRRRMLTEVVADLDAVLLGDDLAIELRMHQRDVVALHVVVGVHLPVRGDLVRQAVAVGEGLEGLVGGGREERPVIRGQHGRVRIEVDEHQAAPLLDPHREQPELGNVEVGAEVAPRTGATRPGRSSTRDSGRRDWCSGPRAR